MRLFKRRSVAQGETANDTEARSAASPGSARSATIISAIAVAFSAYGLWENSLKQADLSVYASGTVIYTTDPFGSAEVQEAGGHEVLAVPVTIANSGARDAAILSLDVEANNATTTKAARFDATYMADGTYFAVADKARRPKTPFAALVVTGRSVWSGTVLFYSTNHKVRVITPKDRGRVDLTLRAVTTPPGTWLDRMLATAIQPVELTLDVPEFSDPFAGVHAFARLQRLSAAP